MFLFLYCEILGSVYPSHLHACTIPLVCYSHTMTAWSVNKWILALILLILCCSSQGFNKYRVSDITKSAETLVLAEFYGKGWSSMNSGCFNFKENRMKMTALLHPAQSAGVLSYLINKSKSYFLLRWLFLLVEILAAFFTFFCCTV